MDSINVNYGMLNLESYNPVLTDMQQACPNFGQTETVNFRKNYNFFYVFCISGSTGMSQYTITFSTLMKAGARIQLLSSTLSLNQNSMSVSCGGSSSANPFIFATAIPCDI